MDPLIDGVSLTPLRIIEDARGAVLHMVRAGAATPTGIGEVYFSAINPGIVKAWKRHHRMVQRLAVPVGRVKFVLFDNRPASPSHGRFVEVDLGRPDAYRLLVIPPGIWYGWKNLAPAESVVANCADGVHEAGESEHADTVAGMPEYQW